MHRSVSSSDGESVRPLSPLLAWLTRLSGASVVLAAVLVVLLYAFPVDGTYRAPAVLGTAHFTFGVLCSLLAAVFLAQRFLSGSGLGWLWLGAGALTYGAACLITTPFLLTGAGGTGPPGTANAAVHHIGMASAGLLSLAAGTAMGYRSRSQPVRGSLRVLALGYGGTLTLLCIIAWMLLADHVPSPLTESFQTGALRHVALATAVMTLTAAAALLVATGYRRASPALSWYGLGLALTAVAFLGQLGATNWWSLLAWVSHLLRYLGAAYLLLGAALSVREFRAAAAVPVERIWESEERLQMALESGGAGLWIRNADATWHVTAGLGELFGLPAGSRPLHEEEYLALIHPDDLPEVAKAWTAAIANKSSYSQEYRVVWPDGSVHWLATRGKVTDVSGIPQFVGITYDITQRRAVAAALDQSEAMFRTFIRQSRDGIVIIDGRGTIVEWNEGEEQITGISRSEALGRPLWEVQVRLVPEEARDPAFLQVAKDRLFRGLAEGVHLQRTLEEEIQRPDGARRNIQSVLFPLRIGDETAAGAIVRDVTERKREERRMARYNSVLAGIERIFVQVVSSRTAEEVGSVCLAAALDLTGSTVGFISQIDEDGQLREIAISNLGRSVNRMVDQDGNRTSHGDVPVESFYHRVLKTGQSAYTNTPATQPESANLPKSHPPVTSLLGVPLSQGGQIVGVIAVGNREGGYCRDQQEDLESLAPAIVQALSKKRAEEALLRRTEELEASNRANETLLREVNHRVKNNLSTILGLISAEQRHLSSAGEPACLTILENLSDRVWSLAAVHTMLSAGGWRPLQLSALAEEVILAAGPAGRESQELQLDVTPSSVRVTPEQAHHLALVIGELATNTAKYGHVTPDVQISVGIEVEGDQICLTYRDRGPGYPPEVLQDGVHSVGLRLVNTIVSLSLRGRWTLANDGGAVTEVRFPLSRDLNGAADGTRASLSQEHTGENVDEERI